MSGYIKIFFSFSYICFMNLLLWRFFGTLLYILLAMVKYVSLWFLLTATESSHKIEQWSKPRCTLAKPLTENTLPQ